jgi:predicted aspartyl protease
MPRRLPYALLLACLVLAACATGPSASGFPRPTIAEAPAQGCNLVRVATVPIAQERGLWVVPVEINAGRLRLILDTGAERTLLTESAVARIGMPRDPHHATRTFAIGGLSTAPDAEVTSFAIGGAYLPVPSVTVGPFALAGGAGAPLDGLLGADVLSAFDVDIDARDGRLTLYRARDCPDAGPPWPEPFLSLGTIERQRDRLLVPIMLDGEAGAATMDTGAQHTVVSEHLAERAGATPADMAHDRRITAHGASAEPLSVHVHPFRLLRIGPWSIENPVLPVLPIPQALGDGLVGDDFLTGRRLWLSYASLRVFMTGIPARSAGGDRAGAEQADAEPP